MSSQWWSTTFMQYMCPFYSRCVLHFSTVQDSDFLLHIPIMLQNVAKPIPEFEWAPNQITDWQTCILSTYSLLLFPWRREQYIYSFAVFNGTGTLILSGKFTEQSDILDGTATNKRNRGRNQRERERGSRREEIVCGCRLTMWIKKPSSHWSSWVKHP